MQSRRAGAGPGSDHSSCCRVPWPASCMHGSGPMHKDSPTARSRCWWQGHPMARGCYVFLWAASRHPPPQKRSFLPSQTGGQMQVPY